MNSYILIWTAVFLVADGVAQPPRKIQILPEGSDKHELRTGLLRVLSVRGGNRFKQDSKSGEKGGDSFLEVGQDADSEEYPEPDHGDGVYDLAHFFYNVEDLVFSEIDGLNTTLSEKLLAGERKISELERQLETKDVRINALEESLRDLREREGPRDPAVGDVRLLAEERSVLWTRGRLLVYTGQQTGWGFVCDDMFYSDSASVACRQLGYSRGVVQVGRVYSLSATGQFDQYSIVLDDVVCDYDDLDLISCQHLPIGIHNCQVYEAVDLMCFR